MVGQDLCRSIEVDLEWWTDYGHGEKLVLSDLSCPYFVLEGSAGADPRHKADFSCHGGGALLRRLT